MNDRLRARIRAGDREAFAAVYEEHARSVYNHAFRLTGDWSVAEEVMADTFLDAWRTRERLEPDGGSVKPWLLAIATNKARNAARGTGRRLAFLSRRHEPDMVPDFAEESAGRIDDARRLAAVQQAMALLRRGEREVLALCVWAGLGYADAASALGVPVGTVRSRLSRARAKLRGLADRQIEHDRDGHGEEHRYRGRSAAEYGPGAATTTGARGPVAPAGTPARQDGAAGRQGGDQSAEPPRRRGEMKSEAAFAALPLRRFQEGSR